MRTIGLIGGMAWPSTLEYYRIINEQVGNRLGRNHSGKIVLISVDFQEVEKLQYAENWTGLDNVLSEIAVKVEKAGADAILICSNTMHSSFKVIQSKTGVPVLHIANAVGDILNKDGIIKAGLLGTRFLIESGLYSEILFEKFGIESILPDDDDKKTVNDIIYNELVKGIVNQDSRDTYLEIIKKLEDQGAEAIILGCTEIPLLISSDHVSLPVYNTTEIHANYAVDFMLE
ncbi:aspartate/glutamate racemase family protein [Bacteroidota bacterium]